MRGDRFTFNTGKRQVSLGRNGKSRNIRMCGKCNNGCDEMQQRDEDTAKQKYLIGQKTRFVVRVLRKSSELCWRFL